ncbi:Hypothetical predicted protein [Lecanosticta acicola]|uniref:Velvet domain-containing protein n=1 Tax=Lecanosticta acicola TaxID=111012 RepID=A0AAI8YZE0_9PEZI|nr:Hypothetical predicted protein [Lecanosticta acicola]
MSQSSRPAPIQPPFASSGAIDMAQAQRASNFPTSNFFARPEQRQPGPQLPPIHSIPPNRSAYDNGRPVQLPPMQLSPNELTSPKAQGTRAIPVAQLLSTNPPSPPRSQAAAPAQQSVHRRSPSSSYSNPAAQYRAQPSSYPRAPQHPLEQGPMPFRQQQLQQPMYQPQHQPQPYSQVQFAPAHPPVQAEPGPPRHYSPAVSAYSSPSYTHSEISPRSSIGPSSQAGFTPKARVSQVPPLEYNLNIRQQPAAARACGFGERDRRVIDPPPILELKITDRATGAPELDCNAMFALHCILMSPDGNDDETELPPAQPDAPYTRRLMGTLVASPYQAKDEHGIAGTFFVFPDLSCRSPGKYRLRFKLLRIDPTNMQGIHNVVASIITDVFSVYTAKDFPGMRASSALLKALRRQGLNVGVKKGSEARKGKGKAKKEESSGSSSDDDESDNSSSVGASPRTKARKKRARRMN